MTASTNTKPLLDGLLRPPPNTPAAASMQKSVLQGSPQARSKLEKETSTSKTDRASSANVARMHPGVHPLGRRPSLRWTEKVKVFCLVCTVTRKRQSRFFSRLWVTNESISRSHPIAKASRSHPIAKASRTWPKTERKHCDSWVYSARLAMPLLYALHSQSTACRN